MSDGTVLVGAFLLGAAIGALAVLVWRARRERDAAIETELLRARLKSEESLSGERELALTRAREQLQAVFGELARETLQSNSETVPAARASSISLTSNRMPRKR